MCIENIVDLQVTYSVINLSLSNLIEEILGELNLDFIPILEIRVFLQSLRSVPFTDEIKGELILYELNDCIKNQLYQSNSTWTSDIIKKYILKLQMLVLWDYDINGFLVMYNDNEIKWDMEVSFVLNEGEIEIFNATKKKEVNA